MGAMRAHAQRPAETVRRPGAHRARARRLLGATAVLLAAASGASLAGGPTATAATPVRSADFKAGVTYVGGFPDPAVIRTGGTYVAYATTLASKTLPVMTSSSLRDWAPRYSTSTRSAWENDGMPVSMAARWARRSYTNRSFVSSWAPSVGQLANRTWLVAYAPPTGSGKRCISVATSASALGPFRDVSGAPIVCPSNQGAIDPFVYVAGSRAWLLWKTEGRPRAEPTKMWSRELNPNIAPGGAVTFASGSLPRLLLTTAQVWEGNVIENPAMITYGGRTYLFYSANQWVNRSYAIGYARCAGPVGPCTRPRTTPLLASGADVTGPGGPAPVVGPTGELLVGYAAFAPNAVGPGQPRRLSFSRLAVATTGDLSVRDRVYLPPA